MSTDDELLERLRNGGTEALGELYDRYSGLVYGIARTVLSSIPEAEDLTQEVFLGLVSDRRYDSSRGSLPAFLAVVTRSRGIDRLRARTRRLRLLQRHQTVLAPASAPFDPLRKLTLHEFAQRVREALSGLSESERQVLELAYYKDLTQSEIAAHLGAPLGTVKSWARKGLQNLRAALEDAV